MCKLLPRADALQPFQTAFLQITLFLASVLSTVSARLPHSFCMLTFSDPGDDFLTVLMIARHCTGQYLALSWHSLKS